MNKSEQLALTKQQIEKASSICRQVGELLKAGTPVEGLEKTDVSEGFFQNPAQAILNEESLLKAPEPIVALAAFMAQAVEGLQNGFKVLNGKVDFLMGKYAETTEAVLKAQSDTLDLVKASLDQPVEQFRAPAAFVHSPSQIPQSNQFSKAQIINALEQMVELKKATPQDIALFETSGRISPYLESEVKSMLQKRNN